MLPCYLDQIYMKEALDLYSSDQKWSARTTQT